MRAVSLLAAAALLMCAPALAKDCGTLKLISSFDLVSAPGNTAEYVPVEIAGVHKLLLLDTGESVTLITAEAAKALKLEGHRTQPFAESMRNNAFSMSGSRVGARVYGASGAYSEYYVLAPLVLGRLKDDKVRFMIAPEGEKYGDDPRVAGVLGADLLRNFDVSVDFAKHTLALIDQDHCAGNVVYWRAPAVAVVPFELLRSGLIVFPLTLDGHRVKAILDTGIAKSVLYRRPAEDVFSLQLGSADTPTAGTLEGEKGKGSTIWRHTFKTLTFKGVTVSNPTFNIIPNRIRKHIQEPELGSLIAQKNEEELQPDVLLGMNVMKYLHVYIAYREKKLYITPAGPAAPSKAKPN